MDTETKNKIGKILLRVDVVLTLVLIIILLVKCWDRADKVKANSEEIIIDTTSVCVSLLSPDFLLEGTPSDNLYEALVHFGIEYPEIVQAQAILETGNYRSRIFREYNNLFGLYNPRISDYYKYEHWSESIVAYKIMIQSRYSPPEDYYDFLERIGYAEDMEYCNKLRKIVKYEINE